MMKRFLLALVAACLAAPAGAWSGWVTAENFVPNGGSLAVRISVSTDNNPATGGMVVATLPAFSDYLMESLSCSSGTCVYNDVTRTVTWTGTMVAWDTLTIDYDLLIAADAPPGYVVHEVQATDASLPDLTLTRTTCLYRESDHPLRGPIFTILAGGSGWSLYPGESVEWIPAASWFLVSHRWTDTTDYGVRVVPVTASGLVGTSQILSSGEPEGSPLLACSPAAGRCLVVWQRTEAVGTRHDIIGRFVANDGSPVGSEFVVSGTAGDETCPGIVHNPVRDEFLVVWSTAWADGRRDVSAQRIRASDGIFESWANIATGTDGDRSWLRAAHLAGRDQYLLGYVYVDGTDQEVRGKLAPGDLAGVSVAPEAVLVPDTLNPATSFQGPEVAAAHDEYLVTFYDGAGRLLARKVAGDGTLFGPATGHLLSAFGSQAWVYTHHTEPAGAQGFMVMWGHDDAYAPTTEDIHGRFIPYGHDEVPDATEFPVFDTVDWDFWGAFGCSPGGLCLAIQRGTEGGFEGRFLRTRRFFADGFESGAADGWSAAVGSVP